MAGAGVEFLTPIGRLVQGDCFVPQEKDQKGNPLTIKNGPNAGQPTKKYFIAVAYLKTDPAWPAFKKLLEDTARRDFPTLFPNPAAPCINPNFAFKIVDGDGYDTTGTHNATKEGFAGHWVVRFSSMYPPKCFAAGKYQPHEQLQLAGGVNPIPRGYKVRVAGTIKGNDDTMKPGLHVSHSLIEFAAVDTIISSGPNAAAIFGGGATPAAGGLTMTAAAGATTYEQYKAGGWTDEQLIANGLATRPAAPPPPPAAQVAPPPTAQVAPPPPAPVQPHTAILNPTAGGLTMTAAAGATTYEQYKAGGWTDEQLIANGLATRPAAPPPPPAAQVAPPPPPPLATGGSAPPPPPAGTAAAPPPPGPRSPQQRMLPAAGATTYDAYIASGWNEAMLIQNGFMAAA